MREIFNRTSTDCVFSLFGIVDKNANATRLKFLDGKRRDFGQTIIGFGDSGRPRRASAAPGQFAARRSRGCPRAPEISSVSWIGSPPEHEEVTKRLASLYGMQSAVFLSWPAIR